VSCGGSGFNRATRAALFALDLPEFCPPRPSGGTNHYVYVIRSKGGSSNGAGKRGPKQGRPRAASGSNGTAERALINAALELGFGRARQILDSAQARIRQSV
jgi:hypothetical protein